MTAENFQACLAFTLKYEGGRSNDPRDPGGRTMEGVIMMQATYNAYRDKKALVRKDVFTIEAAERDEIYRNEYWDHIDGNGVVTSLKVEHENSASRIFSNDRDCLAPHVHSRRAKGSVRPCRSEMTLDVESVVGGCVS